ncbi:sugar phosphate isomerase/epimerase [Pantoea sp. Aalb]|uniref:sugar phosphate isomerase/epimerase family protein n=1 Tax=Pantoea sp. Aalb TaxID=2576762 RepID=UPI001329146A|nr:sugar phosphate isomerase/epimerase family protein [Pantoea sp. Aalb]MXP67145.1 sugar phosphate isomerase/epimerase [Pantoea sp. Aalb]
MITNPKFLNLILLSGKPERKLCAARAAGFEQVEIWREDVHASAQGAIGLGQLAKQQKLSFTNLQVLRDFTGVPDCDQLYKREELREFIHIASDLGCDTIQAPASTREDCLAEHIDEDLCWMALEAARYNMRIMYEPMSWCIIDNTLPRAWERLKRLKQPNLGLVVDLFHICALGGDASQLDGIPADRIYSVQLCDMAALPPQEKGALMDIARHQRLLPGDGIIKVENFIDKLKSVGYSGPVGIEVFNDVLQEKLTEVVAQQAWQALNRYWP